MIKIHFVCIVSVPIPTYICFPKESPHQIQTKHGDSFGYAQMVFSDPNFKQNLLSRKKKNSLICYESFNIVMQIIMMTRY